MKASENQKKYQHKNPLQRFLIKRFQQALYKLIASLNLTTMLDVGCGEGFLMDYLAKQNIQVKSIGVDINLDAIMNGKDLFPAKEMINGSAYRLPVPSHSFDLVLCSEVLEHLDSPRDALIEIKRVMKCDCVITVPNEPLFMITNFLRGKNVIRFGNHIEHIQHWNVTTFQKFLKENGLVIKKKSTPFPWIIILASNEEL